MKPTLNEQLARMQKIAGIITENLTPSKKINLTPIQKKEFFDAIKDLSAQEDFEYALEEAGNVLANILTNGEAEYIEDVEDFGYDAEEVEQYAMDLAGESELDENKESYYKDAEKDDAAHIDALEKDMKDDAKKTSEGKMTKSDLKAKIKEMILAELTEDDDVDINNPGDLNNMYDPLAEAKKDEEVEDVTVDDTEVVDAPASDMMAGESAEISGIQSNLQSAYAEAKALGDEKLITQIANTITYFTKAHILDTAPVNESQINEVLQNDDLIYDRMSDMDQEQLVSMILSFAESNPSVTLVDYLNNEFGYDDESDNDDNYDDNMDVYDDSYPDMAESKNKTDQINENMFPMLKRIIK